MKGSVGTGGRNHKEDVQEIQTLLNRFVSSLGLPRLAVSGRCSSATIRAIRRFEVLAMRIKRSDGRIEPGSRTYAALRRESAGRLGSNAAEAVAKLSGMDWWARHGAAHADSDLLHDLAPVFHLGLRDFIVTLRRGGANVVVRATRHDAVRAHVGHWAWQVALGAVAAANVPDNPQAAILWDHGDDLDSRTAARNMLTAAGIESLPPLESPHIDGIAAELTIDWTGPIDVQDRFGVARRLDRPRSVATNADLRALAATYGILNDRAHPTRWLARLPVPEAGRGLVDA